MMLATTAAIPIGIAVVVGASLGVHLGNSTISAIKPNLFLGAAVHPRDRGAAIDPREIEARRLARRQASYDRLYGWDEGNRALRLACSHCGGDPPRMAALYDARIPYFGSREEAAYNARAERHEIDRRYEARLDSRAVLEVGEEPLDIAEESPKPDPLG